MGSLSPVMRGAEPLQSRGPIILATADIHSPHYLMILKSSLTKLSQNEKRACLVLLAGDIVDRGRIEAAAPVFNMIREHLPDAKLVAVFGNEEYHELENEFKRVYSYVDWLDDEYRVYECGDSSIGIVGTRGSLEKPTRWQQKNMPWLARIYKERPSIIRRLLQKARGEADKVILLSHYALSKATIKGEHPAIWPHLYDPAMESVIREEKPDAAVHGHAHKGRPYAVVGVTPVYNVALPLNRRLVRLRFRIALENFL